MADEVEHVEAIAVSGNALEQIERASIDIQIATAKAHPRSMEQFRERALAMVTMDVETALSCIYRRPVGKEGGQMKYAEGESVRLAEIVASSYGNIRVGGRITEMNPRSVKAQGVAHDLETNTLFVSEAVESTVNRQGVPFTERMRVVVAKAAQSKAIRDATFRVIPKSLCKFLVTEAKLVAQGDRKTFEERRKAVVDWIKTLKIDVKRVWNAIGIRGAEDIDMQVLVLLAGLKNALDDGDCTVDETFPKPEAEQNKGSTGSTTDRIKDKLENKSTQTAEPPEKPKRKRRTKAQIEADKKAEEEAKAQADLQDQADATFGKEPESTEAPEGGGEPDPTEQEQTQEPPADATEEPAEQVPQPKYQCQRCLREFVELDDPKKCPKCFGEKMKEL